MEGGFAVTGGGAVEVSLQAHQHLHALHRANHGGVMEGGVSARKLSPLLPRVQHADALPFLRVLPAGEAMHISAMLHEHTHHLRVPAARCHEERGLGAGAVVGGDEVLLEHGLCCFGVARAHYLHEPVSECTHIEACITHTDRFCVTQCQKRSGLHAAVMAVDATAAPAVMPAQLEREPGSASGACHRTAVWHPNRAEWVICGHNVSTPVSLWISTMNVAAA
mmetsp:Transcript_15404/g.30882  ORF Transcript_15404/g.30882 Transcript_15404/m.30882 type:complete len:222 (+) Transcript_15404:516-1181(+)